MTLSEVEAIKDKLQDKKTEVGVAQKQLEKITASFKEDFDVKNIKAAKEYAVTLEKDIKTLKVKEGKEEDKITELLEAMEDDDEENDD